MKSKVTIDYERGHEMSPIIKIIAPCETNPENLEDPRDKLVADFLHTPLRSERNHLFELATYGGLIPKSDTEISTIKPIPYERVLTIFRTLLLDRYVKQEDLWGYHETYTTENHVNGTHPPAMNPIIHCINEFFENVKLFTDVNNT